MAAFNLDVEVTGFSELEEFFAGWSPKAVDQRLKGGIGKGARIIAAGIRSETPVGATRALRRSVRSRTLRDRPGKGPAAVAGVRRKRGSRRIELARQGLKPTDWAPHGGLVAGGHRIVTRGGRDTGRRARANPFAERGFSKTHAAAEAAVSRELEKGL